MTQNEISRKVADVFRNNSDLVFVYDSLKERKLTYGELFEAAINWKNIFQSLDITKGQKVAFYLQNSLEFVTAYFGSLVSGIVAIPVDTNKGRDEVNELLSISNPDYVIYDKKNFVYQVRGSCIDKISNEVLRFKHSFDNIDQIINSLNIDTPYLITFTSGSTGKPKGVIHSFENLIKSAESFNQRFGFSSENRFLHHLPMSYMAGILNSIILPFITQSKIILGSRFSFSNFSNF